MPIIDNNQMEVRPSARKKLKMSVPLPNTFANPALDLLAHEDRMDNATMEVHPGKKRKRTKSCAEPSTFDNTALDLGTNQAPVNEILMQELENVKRNVKTNQKSMDEAKDLIFEPNLPVQKPLSPLIVQTLSKVKNTTIPETNSSMIEIDNLDSEVDISTPDQSVRVIEINEPVYANVTDVQSIANYSEFAAMAVQAAPNSNCVVVNNHTNINLQNSSDVSKCNPVFPNNQTNLNLSFIDRLGLDSNNLSNNSLYLDDDLNESNIMEIKTITVITKKKLHKQRKSTNPFLNNSDELSDMTAVPISQNPFINMAECIDVCKNTSDTADSSQQNNSQNGLSENAPHYMPCTDSDVKSIHVEHESQLPQQNYTQFPVAEIVPRRLFTGDNNTTVSTLNDLSINYMESQPEYENIIFRPESPIYSNIEEVYEANMTYNKQSKILGCDVSTFNSRDILNLNARPGRCEVGLAYSISSNDSDSKKSDFTQRVNKLSKKVIKKIKKTFTAEKQDQNRTLNPYEVSRKPSKVKAVTKDAGFENPALNLNYSDEIEEIYDEEHVCETVKTARNTHLNMNVTPLKECNREVFDQTSHFNTSGKKQVRFDSTLNQEKLITGNSFEGDVMSPGLDDKIDDFHDELENCINERKFIAQNM